MPSVSINGSSVLFIHIPRTGGSSIEQWLGTFGHLSLYSVGMPLAYRCTPQHFRPRDIEPLISLTAFSYAFAVVRNPFDRLLSEYRLQAELERERFWGNVPKFSLWLETNLSRRLQDPYILDNHLRPQWEFIEDGIETFRFEDGLSDIVARVANKLGVPPPNEIGRVYQTTQEKNEIIWKRTDIEMVVQAYEEDFCRFDYPLHPVNQHIDQ